MLKPDLVKYLNKTIINKTKNIKFIVKDAAPNTFEDLMNQPSLVVWSGASENTIFNDPIINYKLRALHDLEHLKTGLNFSPLQEIELGRIQASQFESSILADLIYIEVSLQAEYYLKHRQFIENQVNFTIEQLKTIRGLK